MPRNNIVNVYNVPTAAFWWRILCSETRDMWKGHPSNKSCSRLNHFFGRKVLSTNKKYSYVHSPPTVHKVSFKSDWSTSWLYILMTLQIQAQPWCSGLCLWKGVNFVLHNSFMSQFNLSFINSSSYRHKW